MLQLVSPMLFLIGFAQDDLILQRILLKLFHIEEAIDANSANINSKNKELKTLRKEQKVHNDALEAARAEQAKARTTVLQKEKQVKKAEKDLDAKKPDLVTIEAQIAHATRKLDNAVKSKGEIGDNEAKLRAKVEGIKKELELVKKDAAKAADEQRRASRHNVALSDESLAQYQAL